MVKVERLQNGKWRVECPQLQSTLWATNAEALAEAFRMQRMFGWDVSTR